MRTLRNCFFIIFTLSNLFSFVANAYAWGDKSLVKINDMNFSKEDFKQWWANWKEDKSSFPNDLNSFIEWHLLVEEAKKMEFDTLPSYKKKLETFLRVRGIFLLKNEEIDTKIKITDNEILNYFHQKYNPIWNVTICSFNEESIANNSYDLINKNGFDNYINDYTTSSVKNKIAFENKKYSPISFRWNDILLSKIVNMKEGDIAQPFLYEGKYLIIKLISIEKRSDELIESHKDKIIKDIRKLKQAELTKILLDNLKLKYKINVDRNLMQNSDFVNISSEMLNSIFITSTNGNILYSNFVNNVIKESKSNKLTNSKEIDNLKEAILNGMLFDLLIAWEIIDRHYENKSPLSNSYEFYKKNRLVVEFNKEVFEKRIKTNEDDLINYYNNHLDEFTKPDKISLSIINVDPELAGKIFNEIKEGKDFFEVVRKYQHSDSPIQQIMMNDLEPDIKRIVNKLSSGEVSEPELLNNRYVIIKLINKLPPNIIPFEQVTPNIADKLYQQKMNIVKSEYMAKIKSQSKIYINNDIWNDLRKEFGESNVHKDN